MPRSSRALTRATCSPARFFVIAARTRSMRACSESRWVETETYSPIAIDRAPETTAATPDSADQAPEDWREVHPILSEPFVAVTPPGAKIEDLPLILYTARHLMGRQIAAHLARHGLKPAHRFELDSYAAILAMVAGGEGWTSMTISTPTGEGVTNARSFVRLRRCVLVDNFRIV